PRARRHRRARRIDSRSRRGRRLRRSRRHGRSRRIGRRDRPRPHRPRARRASGSRRARRRGTLAPDASGVRAPYPRAGHVKPRVLFVSREWFTLPLEGVQRRKWDALAEVLEPRVLAAAPAGMPTRDERFRLVGRMRPRFLDGALFYLLLPWRIARQLREFRPDAALVQGVHETAAFLVARRLAGTQTKVILDVQGDWRAATRLYGSSLRRLLNPLSDAL